MTIVALVLIRLRIFRSFVFLSCSEVTMSTSDELSPPSSASLSKSQSGGALKLLDDLDELASLLGTDISKPRVWKSSKSETQTITEVSHIQPQIITRVELSKVFSTRGGENLQQAIDSGRLDTLTGYYKDVGGISQKLADVLDREVINADSAAFVNPDNGDIHDLQVCSLTHLDEV